MRVALAQDEAKRASEHRNKLRKMRREGASDAELKKVQAEYDAETEARVRRST